MNNYVQEITSQEVESLIQKWRKESESLHPSVQKIREKLCVELEHWFFYKCQGHSCIIPDGENLGDLELSK